jgi:hypothetical protein
MRSTSGSEEMDMPIWDKAVLFHDIEAFVDTCRGWRRRVAAG